MSAGRRSRISVCVTICLAAGGRLPADAQSDFEMVFGEDVKKVAASGNAKDAAALAQKMLELSEKLPDTQRELKVLLWTKAVEYGSRTYDGCETAGKAIGDLMRADEGRKGEWQEKLLAVRQRRYELSRGMQRRKAASELLGQLIAVADIRAAGGKAGEGLKLYRKAMALAGVLRSRRRSEIVTKIKSATALVAVERRIEVLRRRIEKDAGDVKARTSLILLYLLELSDPAKAAGVVSEDVDEATRTYIPLAAKPVAELAEPVCLEMAQWYVKLSADAGSDRGKATALGRARAYFQRFLSLHTDKDIERLRGTTGLSRVEAQLKKLPPGLVGAVTGVATEPIVIADFESPMVGWQSTGTGFGRGPSNGMAVPAYPARGFVGKGMISSYHGGDGSTGTLTSPSFVIRAPRITFLIGGGSFPGATCMNLLVDGKVVRTATGARSNTLRSAHWDVADLVGKTARIQMVDTKTGGWGHVLVDQIVQRPGSAKPS